LLELGSRWPLLVLEEAQNLSASALEEVRLLTCARTDTRAPFSLLLVGDDSLLPRLQLGINRALISRLGFALALGRLEPAHRVIMSLRGFGPSASMLANPLRIKRSNCSSRLLADFRAPLITWLSVPSKLPLPPLAPPLAQHMFKPLWNACRSSPAGFSEDDLNPSSLTSKRKSVPADPTWAL
jgi:hypothetical protein